ncbi:MAG: GAF domain-containing protein, partial [Anaerolineae bacterium]
MDKPGLQSEQPKSANHELEQRVHVRTADLARANEILKREIAARRTAELALQRHNRELKLLYEVARKLSSSLELQQVIAMVLDEARHLLHATGCTIWRPEPEKERITCWQASGSESARLSGLQVPMGQGLVGWTAQQHRELLVPDTRADARHFKGIDAETGVEIRSILCLPLQIHDRLIAVLEVVSDQASFFAEADLALLRPLAASAAIAIDNARLYHEAHELRTFNENIVQHMREGILLEDGTGQITFANQAAAEMLDCSIEDLLGRTWHSLIAPEHLEWIGVVGSGGRYEAVLRTSSETRLPVLVSSQTIRKDDRPARRLTTFTDISDRKAADEALRRRNQELSLLNRLIASAAEVQTVREILGAVCREVAFAFHASYAAAALFDEHLGWATVIARYPADHPGP